MFAELQQRVPDEVGARHEQQQTGVDRVDRQEQAAEVTSVHLVYCCLQTGIIYHVISNHRNKVVKL